MTTPLLVGLYVILGICLDFLIVRYYNAVSDHMRFLAGVYGWAITLFTVYVLDALITGNNKLMMLAYAVGNGIGTYLGVGNGMDRRS